MSDINRATDELKKAFEGFFPEISAKDHDNDKCAQDNEIRRATVKKQHPYQIIIPKGYQYCPDCELITPHTLDSRVNPSKAYPEDWECDVCSHRKDGYSLCPMCGWEHDPDRDLLPVTIKVKKHTLACCSKRKDWDFDEEGFAPRPDPYNNDCDCPEVDAYPVQHIFNYSRTPAHWNMECPNAMEWSYDVMCPICNYVFEVDDGNC